MSNSIISDHNINHTHTQNKKQALELADDKNKKIGYGMVLLSDLADQKEHDDWFPVFQKKDHQIGWLHLHLCLEKPKHKALDMATTQSASVKGDLAVKPKVPSKKMDDLSILDGKYVMFKRRNPNTSTI